MTATGLLILVSTTNIYNYTASHFLLLVINIKLLFHLRSRSLSNLMKRFSALLQHITLILASTVKDILKLPLVSKRTFSHRKDKLPYHYPMLPTDTLHNSFAAASYDSYTSYLHPNQYLTMNHFTETL